MTCDDFISIRYIFIIFALCYFQADDNKDGNLSLEEMLNHEYMFYTSLFEEDEEDDELHDELWKWIAITPLISDFPAKRTSPCAAAESLFKELSWGRKRMRGKRESFLREKIRTLEQTDAMSVPAISGMICKILEEPVI